MLRSPDWYMSRNFPQDKIYNHSPRMASSGKFKWELKRPVPVWEHSEGPSQFPLRTYQEHKDDGALVDVVHQVSGLLAKPAPAKMGWL